MNGPRHPDTSGSRPTGLGAAPPSIPNPYANGPRLPQAGGPRRGEVPFEPPDPAPPSIRGAVIGWTIFWGLWIVPGLFPLLGMPGMLVLMLLGADKNANESIWAGALMLTLVLPTWGMVSLAITGLWHVLATKAGKRISPLPFFINYLFVYFLPVLLLLLFIWFHKLFH